VACVLLQLVIYLFSSSLCGVWFVNYLSGTHFPNMALTYISSDLVINQHWKYYFANLKTGSETELQLAGFVMNILSKPFWISWLENISSEGFCIVLHISYEQPSRHCCAYSERYVSFVELETHPRMSWQCAYSILFHHTLDQKPRIYLVITGFNLVTPEFRGATRLHSKTQASIRG